MSTTIAKPEGAQSTPKPTSGGCSFWISRAAAFSRRTRMVPI